VNTHIHNKKTNSEEAQELITMKDLIWEEKIPVLRSWWAQEWQDKKPKKM
jgi:hypothetical protein